HERFKGMIGDLRRGRDGGGIPGVEYRPLRDDHLDGTVEATVRWNLSPQDDTERHQNGRICVGEARVEDSAALRRCAFEVDEARRVLYLELELDRERCSSVISH